MSSGTMAGSEHCNGPKEHLWGQGRSHNKECRCQQKMLCYHHLPPHPQGTLLWPDGRSCLHKERVKKPVVYTEHQRLKCSSSYPALTLGSLYSYFTVNMSQSETTCARAHKVTLLPELLLFSLSRWHCFEWLGFGWVWKSGIVQFFKWRFRCHEFQSFVTKDKIV